MAFDRAAIYAQLLTQIQAKINTTSTPALAQPVSRRARDLSQIGPDEQPACFLVAGDEEIQQEKGSAPKRAMHAHVLIYVRTDDPAQSPADILFPLIKLVEQSLAWQVGDGQTYLYGSLTTLQGLVQHCRLISVEINAGIPSGEGTALLTLDILAVGGVTGAPGA